MTFREAIDWVGTAIDTGGVAVIALGAVYHSVSFLARARNADREHLFRSYRQGLGRSILLGLELLVAGDIIRTVAIRPTFTSVGVLAAIVAIRTFLSWSLEVELTGRWPWDREPRPRDRTAQA